ncbi:MAG: ATP-binding protein [Acidiferrobacterales bacterium]
MSLNARIALSASVVLAAFIALTAVALDRAFRESARSAMQERLLGQIYLLMAAAEVDPEGRLSMAPTLPEARFALPGSGLYGQVTRSNGEVAWRSHSTLGVQPPFSAPLDPGKQRIEEREDTGARPFYVLSFGVNWTTDDGGHAFTFAVAEDLSAFYAQIHRYRRSLWGWLGAMALLLLITQALVLRWGLRPLRQVAQELAAIEAGRQERLNESYPRELRGLTSNLNALLSHERTQQKRYRDALADLAHSLKTPLAVLRGAPTGDHNKKGLLSTVEEQVERMDHIVQYQLQRAAAAGRTTLVAPVSIKPIVLRIIDSLDKVHHQKSVETLIDVGEHVSLRGDEGDLMEMFGNLIDNAYKWCRGRVRVHAEEHDGQLTIVIEDDGPGISPSEAERLLQRGARADQAVPGHGIGLAIVRDIVQAYDGKIAVETGSWGGAAIRLELPAS